MPSKQEMKHPMPLSSGVQHRGPSELLPNGKTVLSWVVGVRHIIVSVGCESCPCSSWPEETRFILMNIRFSLRLQLKAESSQYLLIKLSFWRFVWNNTFWIVCKWLDWNSIWFFFFFSVLIVWKLRLWVLIDAMCLFLEACQQLPGGNGSGWNLCFRWRQSRRLEDSNLWYIVMDLQECIPIVSSRKATVSVFFDQACCLRVSAGDWGELSDNEEEKKRSQLVLLSWNWHFRVQGWALCHLWAGPVF